MTLNQTHQADRRSWVESANDLASDFPLQNLPYGVFLKPDASGPRIGVAIGDQILDLQAASTAGLLPAVAVAACQQSTLNALMAGGHVLGHELRGRLSELLGADTCSGPQRDRVRACLIPQTGVTLKLPARVGDYTDFYASRFHATNAGTLFRPDQPLLPNYAWVPIGYHGRSSSLVISGTPVRRPAGQVKAADSPAPIFQPTGGLDFELELGVFVGRGNPQGERIPLAEAADHLFGVVLLNDWSARDLQRWESQPLGPFLAKNFATSLSPWVVTLEALAPFRTPAFSRPPGDPSPLPYLTDPADQAQGGLDLKLEVQLLTAQMQQHGIAPHRLAAGNFRQMYWTLAQLLTHHASNGCNLQPGDLLGSGTVSGATPDSLGCLLEMTRGGTQPIRLPNGEERRYLHDGDEVILRGYCERPGTRRIGLGECRGVVLPA